MLAITIIIVNEVSNFFDYDCVLSVFISMWMCNSVDFINKLCIINNYDIKQSVSYFIH